MKLKRVHTEVSTAGHWLLEEVPGVYLYRVNGLWGFHTFMPQAGSRVADKLYPGLSQKEIHSLILSSRPIPRSFLGKRFRTRKQALLALSELIHENPSPTLGEML